MAIIKTLKDNYDNNVYPNTRLDCIYTEDGNFKDVIGNNQDISNIADGSATGILTALSDEYDKFREETNEGQKIISDAIAERGISSNWESGFATLATQIRDMVLVKGEPVPVITQTANVKPTARGIRILTKPDEGITGISQLNASLDVEEKSETVLYGDIEIYSERDNFLTKVTVKGPLKHNASETILSKSEDSYTIPEGYYDGNSKVKVDLQEKSVDISSGNVTVEADDGKVLSKVTIHGPANRGAFIASINAKTPKAIIYEGYHNGDGVISINTQSKTITNNSGSVTVKPDDGYVLSSVTINGPSDNSGTLTSIKPKSIDDTTAVFSIPEDGYYDTTSKFSVSKSILKNNNLIVDNSLYREQLSLKSLSEISGDFIGMAIIDDVPTSTSDFCAVVFRNEIHMLGGNSTSASKTHYKFDGKNWSSVSTLPFEFSCGSAVVYNDEIHIIGGHYSNKKHYKWNGSTWTEVSTLPYKFMSGSATVYNNELHIFGSAVNGYGTNHYKWNGSTWTEVSTLPYDFYHGNAVVYKNRINILGGGSEYGHNHYIWTGTQWNFIGSIHYDFINGLAVVLGDDLHILSGDHINVKKWHCIWNGSKWYFDEFLPYHVSDKAAVAYYGDIYILGSNDNFHPRARTVLHYESILGTLKAHGVNVNNDSNIYTLA